MEIGIRLAVMIMMMMVMNIAGFLARLRSITGWGVHPPPKGVQRKGRERERDDKTKRD